MEKKIVVLGGGESGVGSAVLAKEQGYNIFLSDFGIIKPKYKKILQNHNINFEENKHSKNIILKATEIIKSPGIDDNTHIIKEIKQAKIPIISEIEFAYRYTNAKIIAITGTNGKTTTTLLTYHILKKAGLNVGIAGNIGKSFAMQLTEKHKYDFYVLEISSFQLDYCFNFSPDIAILLNITPDHLDRYSSSFELYAESKFRIIQNLTQNQSFIYCSDDTIINNKIKSKNIKGNLLPFSIEKSNIESGAIKKDKQFIIKNNNKNIFKMTIEQLALQGKHNLYDSMAASISAKLVEISNIVLKESLIDFVNVAHRLEIIAQVHGVEYINDSKATNVNSTWYALESINHPVIWIAGGQDKGNNYKELKPLVEEKVKAIICLGIDNTKIKKAFKNSCQNIYETASMEEAVEISYKLGKIGDCVLLSPACASFDLFENFEDRGNQFKRMVRNL